jgi:hypothetical protein
MAALLTHLVIKALQGSSNMHNPQLEFILLVYAVIQRQVRLYLRAHEQHVPGNKGSTATPTAAVVFTSFAPVMLAQFAVDEQINFQVHGLQPHHRLICDAVGLDTTWYWGPAIRQNSLSPTTLPGT